MEKTNDDDADGDEKLRGGREGARKGVAFALFPFCPPFRFSLFSS